MNNLIKLRLKTLILKILILKLKQTLSKTVIRESQTSTSPEKSSSSNMDLETAIESAVLSEVRSNYTLK